MAWVITVENISKRYRLGAIGATSLREEIESWGKRLRGEQLEEDSRDFWALRDISFEVAGGEILGIVGRNGAGKSTLLKIFSRITQPTQGRVTMHGRVASLLEVGTGFHPELSGRDNIFLNGAILGMKKAEILLKFDQIVEFAEIGKFIDTPVKRYSSGMYVRLAFAVAAHLEPEILIIDEVLAVGDAAFQRKCLGKMKEVSRNEGRTVLFVSHNLAAVRQLCDSAILLENGKLLKKGDAQDIAQQYAEAASSNCAQLSWNFPGNAPGDDRVRLLGLSLVQMDTVVVNTVDINQELVIEFDFQVLKECHDLVSGCNFYDVSGLCLFAHCDWRKNHLKPGRYQKKMHIPAQTFAEGHVQVLVQLIFHDPAVLSVVLPSVLSFSCIESPHPHAVRGLYTGHWPGVVRQNFEWSEAIACE